LRFAWLPLVAAIAVALSSTARADEPDPGAPVEGEKTLESRLLAPCCWQQTLDVHESEIARALRAEIRKRLQAGETAASIESDLVRRHGERMRALPVGKTLTGVGVALSVVVAAALIGVVAIVLRWVRRGRVQAKEADAQGRAGAPASGRRDAWDERLDAELDATDD
jgi:cytochrome c-type biogenesis protein CcmH